MLQLLSALWTTHAIGAFARLDPADAIEDGADDPASIAQLRNLNADRVYRLLRALSTVGIVTETAAGHFALNPLGGLLSSRSPQSMRSTATLLPVPLTPTAGPGRWLDLHMMLLANGRERSLNDYARLFADAGLRLARTLPTQHPAMTVIEAVAATARRAP